MSDHYHPFTPARCEVLRAALLSPSVRDLDDLEALRGTLSGVTLPLGALRALRRDDPTWSERFFSVALPSMLRAAWALVAAGVPAIPVHRAGEPARALIPRTTTPGWVAHMLLGTIAAPSAAHPVVDAALLLSRESPQEVAKLQCILELFARTADRALPGCLTVERRVVPPRDRAGWTADRSPLSAFTTAHQDGIEDATGHLQVDFANASLGGGVLVGGCVQEEIRFAVSPELLVAMLVSPVMLDREAVLIRGAERVAATSGYGFGVRYAGTFDDRTPCSSDGTPDVRLVAIDALDFRRGDSAAQYDPPFILRELDKARAGFQAHEEALPVATGNWGGGAFLGDPALKAVIQWLAASACGRPVRYYPYGDARLAGVDGFIAAARARFDSVGALSERLLDVAPTRSPGGILAALVR